MAGRPSSLAAANSGSRGNSRLTDYDLPRGGYPGGSLRERALFGHDEQQVLVGQQHELPVAVSAALPLARAIGEAMLARMLPSKHPCEGGRKGETRADGSGSHNGRSANHPSSCRLSSRFGPRLASLTDTANGRWLSPVS